MTINREFAELVCECGGRRGGWMYTPAAVEGRTWLQSGLCPAVHPLSLSPYPPQLTPDRRPLWQETKCKYCRISPTTIKREGLEISRMHTVGKWSAFWCSLYKTACFLVVLVKKRYIHCASEVNFYICDLWNTWRLALGLVEKTLNMALHERTTLSIFRHAIKVNIALVAV